jgi:hypothetical protein
MVAKGKGLGVIRESKVAWERRHSNGGKKKKAERCGKRAWEWWHSKEMWEECAWERQRKEEARRVVVKGVGKGDEGVGL